MSLSALSVADGSYSFDLPADASYKLFIQPHEAGYSDQWHGGPDFAVATAILLDTDKTEDVSLAPTPPPTSLHPDGVVSTTGGPLEGAEIYRLRREHQRLCR